MDDIERLAEVCWREITRFFQPDCCILAARIMIDSLARLGEHNAQAITIKVGLYNQAAQVHLKTTGQLRSDYPEIVVPAGQEARVVTLGVRKASNGDSPRPDAYTDATVVWPGHLAVLVRRKVLVDLSISQASNPEEGIPVSGVFVAPVTEAFVTNRAQIAGQTEHGVFALYQAAPETEREGWLTAPDWRTESMMHDPLVDATVSAFRGVPYTYPARVLAITSMIGRI